MKASQRCLAPGFFRRSLDELKRVSHLVVSSQTILGATTPYQLFDFKNADSIEDCKIMSDADMDGYSTSNLDFHSKNAKEPAHATWHGSISTRLPKNRPEIQRSGYAGWRTLDQKPTIFGRGLWDIDPYKYLAMRVKSDGRKYFVNVQTESVIPTDIHQHRLIARKPGEWETIIIRWQEFVRTNHGTIVEPQSEMLREKVRTIGVSITDRVEGPYKLSISQIWATNSKEPHILDEEGLEQPEEKDPPVR